MIRSLLLKCTNQISKSHWLVKFLAIGSWSGLRKAKSVRIHGDPDPKHFKKCTILWHWFLIFVSYRDDQGSSATNHQLQRGGGYTWCWRQNGAEDHGDSRLREIEQGNLCSSWNLKIVLSDLETRKNIDVIHRINSITSMISFFRIIIHQTVVVLYK